MLQKRLAKNLVENIKRKRPQNKRELLVNSGYALESATSVPGKIIEQKGTQEELAKLGFSPNKAKEVIAKIMTSELSEDRDRLKAADMTLQVFGEYAPEKSINMNVSTEDLKAAVLKDIERFRKPNE